MSETPASVNLIGIEFFVIINKGETSGLEAALAFTFGKFALRPDCAHRQKLFADMATSKYR
jgi:hypothetical protein